MRKRYLYLYPLLIVASVMGLLYTATPKAHAALAGEENGPIIYIDNPDSQDPNSVLTSQADGTPNDLPAATSTPDFAPKTIPGNI